MQAGPSDQAKLSTATKPKGFERRGDTRDRITPSERADGNGSTPLSSSRIEEPFIQLESRDCYYSSCLDCLGNCFKKHDCKREVTERAGSETSWAKLVDGEVPCLIAIERALAFRY
jgi:hypothetical protein